ncbi:SCP2 sterol-binding domain-containing protein [Micromonospora sp. NBC_01813]|uniref:SCP2 sterol-binding domain-containing protein n=1 Tax=Micromonospora sp. NBC_01813 TaxID=2975988 RepID=UPI002DD968AE|nr:SCP2 sterol-binding domain-containing protein [Micromonospora sp. NBC_01813]WSA08891.1 SCP2 sterol-binding domain-containing protein [Micromonospora sp. NBC_01813]
MPQTKRTAEAKGAAQASEPMPATREFFDRLGHQETAPLLRQISGTVRFDLADDERVDSWFVTLNKGKAELTRENREADCVLRTDGVIFEAMARGEVNPMAAMLRSQVMVLGDLRLLILIERMMPGPPGSHDPRVFAKRERTEQ